MHISHYLRGMLGSRMALSFAALLNPRFFFLLSPANSLLRQDVDLVGKPCDSQAYSFPFLLLQDWDQKRKHLAENLPVASLLCTFNNWIVFPPVPNKWESRWNDLSCPMDDNHAEVRLKQIAEVDVLGSQFQFRESEVHQDGAWLLPLFCFLSSATRRSWVDFNSTQLSE